MQPDTPRPSARLARRLAFGSRGATQPRPSPRYREAVATALYRRYRSARFADLVGQDVIATTLRHEVRSDGLAHASLFTGIRGTGKTSTARILARAVNCRDPRDGEPCNACTACLEILDGSAVDVLEIDAASRVSPWCRCAAPAGAGTTRRSASSRSAGVSPRPSSAATPPSPGPPRTRSAGRWAGMPVRWFSPTACRFPRPAATIRPPQPATTSPTPPPGP